jgi:hypothetical protein
VSFVTASEATDSEGVEPAYRARLKDRLLFLGAELEGILAFVDGRYEPDPNGPAGWLYEVRSPLADEDAREVLRRWRNVFADELQIVQLARNSVAHAKYISDDNLRNAVTVADRLVTVAKSSVGRDTSNESGIGQSRRAT